MSQPVSDESTRKEALNPEKSFIVQAPAGSGKTELLTQRFLTLLSRVESPEEIIAITFTRKAAQEMRHRVMHALQRASTGIMPEESHRQITFQLANKALTHNNTMQWKLLENPSRLRILTLDALSAMIDQQTPIATAFGAKPEVSDDATKLYEKAAHRLLMDTSDEHIVAAVNNLLLYCQNNIPQFTRLLSQLLATREQWLAHVMPYFRNTEAMQMHLESALLIDEKLLLKRLNTFSPVPIISELEALIPLASQLLTHTTSDSAIITAASNQAGKETLTFWLAVSELMLTKQGSFRKSLTKNQGFPSPSSASGDEKLSLSDNKKRMQALINACSCNELMQECLLDCLAFPSKHYDENHWEKLNSLTQLLPYLVAHLNVCFQQTGKVDFNELTIGALRALFANNEPTYLALKLDHQIKHLLVDECQDTSNLQHELLTHLIDGWSPGDERTLFLVGDPMQSIYRFRNANVSHFLHIQNTGINGIKPEAMQLTRNFRSSSSIIEWINHAFLDVFSPHNDPNSGAIKYAPSLAVKPNPTSTQGVHHYPIDANIPALEAHCIKDIVLSLQTENPKANIAILVRARHQLQALLPVLTEHGIAFHANKLLALNTNPDIQDLMTITRALSHLNDRVAWLALLRSPCFSVSLNDLSILASDPDASILSQLLSANVLTQLSEETQTRLSALMPLLKHTVGHAKRLPLHEWVRKSWHALGGPATLTHHQQQHHVNRFFDELARFGDISDIDAFEDYFSQLYANDTCEKASLSVMTIHQSKGLEFDHVILPGIHRSNAKHNHPMLRWMSTHDDTHEEHLLLACRTHDNSDGIYHYLSHRDKQQLSHELARLFYVACTRAKKSLHLSYETQTPEEHDATLSKARSGSFLALLGDDPWQKTLCHRLQYELSEKAEKPLIIDYSSLKLSVLNAYLASVPAKEQSEENPSFEAIDRIAQAKGNALHAWLAHSVENPNKLSDANTWINSYLRQTGIGIAHRQYLSNDIVRLYENMLNDSIGAWILKSNRDQSHVEYALSVSGKERRKTLVIDRWFVDDGTCWIIDYKTSEHLPSNENEALERHQQQLLGYAHAIKHLRPEPIRVAVYYTEQQRWFNWAFKANTLGN